jgi:hypothetical protein
MASFLLSSVCSILATYALLRWISHKDLGDLYALCTGFQNAEMAAHMTSEPVSSSRFPAQGLEEFLKRVVLFQAALATPRDLAWFLASYAHEAKFRIETGELPALTGIRAALDEAYGG